MRTACILALATMGATNLAQAEVRYQVLDLGQVSNGYYDGVNAISNTNAVSFNSISPSTLQMRGAVWKNGVITDLPGLPGMPMTFAVGISDDEIVAMTVQSDSSPYDSRATTWSAANGLQLVFPGSDVKSDAWGISDNGNIVGRRNGTRVYMKTATDLYEVPPGGLYIDVNVRFGVNNSGEVVGYLRRDDGDFAGYWNPPAVNPQYLTFPTAYERPDFSYANQISNNGQIVGVYDSAYGEDYMFRMDGPDGNGLVKLGTLGGNYFQAMDLNELGEVVGFASIGPGNADIHAFLWTEAEGILDLNDLIDPTSDWVLSYAKALNNNGWIGGTGFLDGELHSFLLIPLADVPEPSSLLLLGAGLGGLLVSRSRRGK